MLGPDIVPWSNWRIWRLTSKIEKERIMNNEKYNGWTNYATWRVNLEIFDGGDWSIYCPTELQEFVEEYISELTNEGLGRDYALAFISSVNWNEIASCYQEES